MLGKFCKFEISFVHLVQLFWTKFVEFFLMAGNHFDFYWIFHPKMHIQWHQKLVCHYKQIRCHLPQKQMVLFTMLRLLNHLPQILKSRLPNFSVKKRCSWNFSQLNQQNIANRFRICFFNFYFELFLQRAFPLYTQQQQTIQYGLKSSLKVKLNGNTDGCLFCEHSNGSWFERDGKCISRWIDSFVPFISLF